MTPREKELISIIVKNPKLGNILLKLNDLIEQTGWAVASTSVLSELTGEKITPAVLQQVVNSGFIGVTSLSKDVLLLQQKKNAKWKFNEKHAETCLANVTVLCDSVLANKEEKEITVLPETKASEDIRATVSSL